MLFLSYIELLPFFLQVTKEGWLQIQSQLFKVLQLLDDA